MSKFTKLSLCFLSLLLTLVGCQKKAFDDYYKRPDDLADPIYKQLQAAGRFSNLLACIDKSGYKSVLAEGGYWTLFAPNDEAFVKFFQEKGISGVDKIDSATARGIVTYGLLYNAYRKDQLTTFQADKANLPNLAFRRKTAYYDFVYTDPLRAGKTVANNRNGNYVADDNNNKYMPYFIDGFVSANGLNGTDYTSFFPASTYTGFNVAGAKVIKADIAAENGIIHETDKVIQPLQNIEQYIASNPNYSEFKKLLDKATRFTYNAALTHRYFVLTGKTDSVFVKSYLPTLAFAPNNEAYYNIVQTDAQSGSWSIAVPTNQELSNYVKTILVNYSTFENAPAGVLADLINSHLFRSAIWPRNLITSGNAQTELPTFADANVIDKKVLSNGNFYGINKPQEANVFRTVYGKSYLDPKYTLMTRAIDFSDLKVAMTAPSTKFTVFMTSNAELRKLGYDFSSERNVWQYTDPNIRGASTDFSTTAQTRVYRLIQSSVLFTPYGEFDNITSGEGIAESYNGEYVKFRNGVVRASGNVVDNSSLVIDSSKVTYNGTTQVGKVYYTTGLLKFAENTETLGRSLSRLAGNADPNVSSKFNYFYQYLSNSSLWTAASFDITGVAAGTFYTMLVPTDAAISDAVRSGLLPGNTFTGIPNFSSALWSGQEKLRVENFIQYHIINKATVAADGKKYGPFSTLLIDNATGDPKTVEAFYPGTNPATFVPNQLEFRDKRFSPSANPPVLGADINYFYSNQLANRALIHSINKVLDFR